MMKIRLAVNSDVRYIHNKLNSVIELRDYKGGEEYPISWVQGVVDNKKDAIVLFCEENGEKIGFIIVFIVLAGKEAIINNLYVQKEYRRKGVASKLISYSEDELKKRGVDFIMLLSQKDNIKMHKFSIMHGYEKGESFVGFHKWLK